jgi:hypothetical protein
MLDDLRARRRQVLLEEKFDVGTRLHSSESSRVRKKLPAHTCDMRGPTPILSILALMLLYLLLPEHCLSAFCFLLSEM